MLIVCPNCASEYDVDQAILGPDGRRVRCSSCGEHWFAAPQPAESAVGPVAASEVTAASPEDDLEAQWRAAALNDPDVQEALAQEALAQEALAQEALAHETQAAGSAPADGEAEPAPALPDGHADGLMAGPVQAGDADQAQAAPAPRKPAGRPDKGRSRKASLRGMEEFRARRPASRAGLIAMLGLCLIGLTLWKRDILARYAPALAGPLAAIGLPVNIRGAEFGNVAGELLNDPSGRFLIVQAQISNITSREIALGPVEIVVRNAEGKAIYTWAAEPQKLKLAPGETMPFRSRLAQPPREAHDVQLRFQRASAQMAQAAK